MTIETLSLFSLLGNSFLSYHQAWGFITAMVVVANLLFAVTLLPDLIYAYFDQ